MITSMFDDDLYKFTMQQAILQLYPNKQVEYRFKNRASDVFDENFLSVLRNEVYKLKDLRATEEELEKFSKLPFVQPWYVEYLRNYRYDPAQVSMEVKDGVFSLAVKGPWHETILWEVKLMALISEIYFALQKNKWSMQGQEEKLQKKINTLDSADAKYADFGTRRRRSYEVQDMVVRNMSRSPNFLGTSNVHLAFKYGVKPIGTMAHEWIQGVSAIESLENANRNMMEKWDNVYDGQLGIALTDTFTTDGFLKDFNAVHANKFNGVRHDSGDPFAFAEKIANHYKELGINLSTKTIIFSDSLTASTAAKLQTHCNQLGIKCAFGIGTHLTNDFDNSKALNMVIKLWSVEGVPVVKLSDDPGKYSGDPWMIDVVKKMYGAK